MEFHRLLASVLLGTSGTRYPFAPETLAFGANILATMAIETMAEEAVGRVITHAHTKKRPAWGFSIQGG